jgi:hypothetical protein
MALRSLIYRERTIAFSMESMAIWTPYPAPCFIHSGLLWQVIRPYLYHYTQKALIYLKILDFKEQITNNFNYATKFGITRNRYLLSRAIYALPLLKWLRGKSGKSQDPIARHFRISQKFQNVGVILKTPSRMTAEHVGAYDHTLLLPFEIPHPIQSMWIR